MYRETFTCDQCNTTTIPPSDARGWFLTFQDGTVGPKGEITITPFVREDAKLFGVKSFCGVPCLLKNLSDAAPRLLEGK